VPCSINAPGTGSFLLFEIGKFLAGLYIGK
jgi:hypothetical protein